MVGSVLGSDPRWDGNRGMGTVALRYSEGKKKKKKTHTALCFCCFSFTLWKTHHGAIMGEHAGAQPWEWCNVLGELSFPPRPVPHTVSWTCCRLTSVFPLLFLLLLQVEGLRDFRPSRWWPATGGWGAGSSARAPRWSCLSPRTSCTCSGWRKPHCSRSGTS